MFEQNEASSFRLDANFNLALYSAEDGVWEIYREDSVNFLAAITESDEIQGKPKHSTLDSFAIDAAYFNENADQSNGIDAERKLEIIFDKAQATVKFSGPPNLESWFSHFLIDLQKNLGSPSFRQKLNVDTRKANREPMLISTTGSLITSASSLLAEKLIDISRAPYSVIILYEQPPNQMVENAKAGLITNFIWVPLIFILGFLFAIFAYWVWSKYGFNLYELFSSPAIPTTTPIP